MAYFNNVAPHIAGSSFGQVIMDTIADIKTRREQRAVYNRTFKALAAMTDADLADIGITRLVIRDVAREAAEGK